MQFSRYSAHQIEYSAQFEINFLMIFVLNRLKNLIQQVFRRCLADIQQNLNLLHIQQYKRCRLDDLHSNFTVIFDSATIQQVSSRYLASIQHTFKFTSYLIAFIIV